jgi:3-hydroxy-3-methylglutaryl CoA synthase
MSGADVGSTGVGAHVPRYRLTAETLGSVWGATGSSARAVANHDEDSLTMAASLG